MGPRVIRSPATIVRITPTMSGPASVAASAARIDRRSRRPSFSSFWKTTRAARVISRPLQKQTILLTATNSSSSELTPWRSSTSPGAPACRDPAVGQHHHVGRTAWRPRASRDSRRARTRPRPAASAAARAARECSSRRGRSSARRESGAEACARARPRARPSRSDPARGFAPGNRRQRSRSSWSMSSADARLEATALACREARRNT